MKTAGEIIKKTRLEKNISLEQVAGQTKIRQNILVALEENDFQKIPSIASIKGFLRAYAQFLDLSPEKILAIFRRDFDKKEKKKVVLSGMVEPLNKRKVNWSPKLTLIVLIGIFFFGLMTYLIYQYLSLVRPPYLKVITPENNLQVKERIIKITGKADPDSLVVINRVTVTLSSSGEFHYGFDLFPGENSIIVTATSKSGRKNSIERTVIYKTEDLER